ncbi:GNAT family protein [uncultured Aliiroseovarius sp.]|uniref:GNAT family N-acetyltransferase n=1 Tax=uncultured Aliiroseovarius sp. TaxID=1658783 RepID=UPI002597F5B0|nr:GNAT family protein [uncultured Aliiroseovarius sp.]
MTTLTTHQLSLRGPRASDIDDLFASHSDPHAMVYWSTPPHAATSVTQGLLDPWIIGFRATPH